MKTEFTALSETRKSLVVEIPTDTVDTAIEKRSQMYRRSTRLPGFRRGKAPLQLVRRRLRDQILQDVAQDLIPRAIDSAIREHGLEPIDRPSIRDVNVDEGKPLTFTATFETLPPIDPGDYRHLTLRKSLIDVAEDAVEDALEEIRQRAAEVQPVEGRTIAHGDVVTVDLDRQPLTGDEAGSGGVRPEPEHHADVDIEIGGKSNPPGFDEQLLGLGVGDTREFSLRYPDDHDAPALAGTSVSYAVVVKQIKERVVPALDDALAQRVAGVDTVDALRDRVREDLTHRAELQAEARVRSDLLRQLAGRLGGEVPATLVTNEVDRRLEHVIRRLASEGVDPRHVKIDWDALRQEQREPAIATVRSTLVLDEISRREGVTVESAELEAELARQAERAGRTVEATRALLEKEGVLSGLETGLRREKTIDLLLREATIVTA